MIRIAHVLCPIDFSEFSRRALDRCRAAITRWYKARLTVLYVRPVRPVMELPLNRDSDVAPQRNPGHIEQSSGTCRGKFIIETCVEEASSVHEEIIRQAGAIGADLLVSRQPWGSGFERSADRIVVTERVVHKALCPDDGGATARARQRPDEPAQFRPDSVPVDFSETSNRALTYAVSLAEEMAAHLTVVNVIEVPPELREHCSPRNRRQPHPAAAEAGPFESPSGAHSRRGEERCTVETAVAGTGVAYREDLKFAAEGDSDLIVMGVHGRGAIDLRLFGSNTARATRAAERPVLIVRG